jgi:hypothetical protein
VSVELQANELVGGSYPTLQTLSPWQQSVLNTYDRAPYSSQLDSIPFLDLGNRFVVVGAGYDPSVLQGKSLRQIAGALSNPHSAIAQGIDGTANTLTAAICQLTGGQPRPVCSSSGTKASR